MRVLRLTHSPGLMSTGWRSRWRCRGWRGGPPAPASPWPSARKSQELIRWYFEDYRQGPADAVTRMRAARAERRLGELGGGLFGAVFEASPATRSLWAAVQPGLAEFRVEVVTDVAGATGLPWEAMTDPGTGQPLALGAGAMVRAQPQAALTPRPA